MRLVDSEGEPLGVTPIAKALDLAREKGVDLVEISPKADPPVCKIIDYGKMLYALKKKEQSAKAKEMKGIRITFRIDEGDLARQREKAKEFLNAGHSLKIQLVMKGREKAHQDLAREKMQAFVDSLAEVSQLENMPRSTGNQITAIVKPSKN
ncbi:translation initiation factor IF-3 [Candidatus Gracilibacteria bacterium]|nr:translation initiation factor IF-3 [Candidatus Gracilibacteria bacterium]